MKDPTLFILQPMSKSGAAELKRLAISNQTPCTCIYARLSILTTWRSRTLLCQRLVPQKDPKLSNWLLTIASRGMHRQQAVR